jgi:hypothetical protein
MQSSFLTRARRGFIEYTHGFIREILTNYGKVDVLWCMTSRGHSM